MTIRFFGGQFKFVAESLRASKPSDDDVMGNEVWEKTVRTLAHDLSQTNPNFNRAAFFRVAGLKKRNQEN